MHSCVFTVNERVLLIGEGNFSFAVGLRELLPLNIIATCLEPEVISETGKSNVEKLREKGVRVYLSVDGTKLTEHPVIGSERFDKVVFNFPHVGGKMKIGLNRTLLQQFLRSAVGVLSAGGKVVVSLCRGQGGTPADDPPRAWSDTWQAVEMAALVDLVLEDVHPFQRELFPHYHCIGYRGRNTAFQLDGALVHVFRPVGPLLPLASHPCSPPSGSPARYLHQQLEAFLQPYVKVQLPSHIAGTLAPHLRAAVLLWSGEHSKVVMAEGLVFHCTRDDFSLPPASLQVLLVRGNTPGLCADFIQHVLTLFHKHESCSILCNVGACSEFSGEQCIRDELKINSDTYVIVKNEIGCKYLVSEEYCVDSNGHNMLVSVLHLDKLAEVMFDVINWRELWADGAGVQIKGMVPSLKRACLYSRPHMLDVTFRESDVFVVEDFHDALWELAGDIIMGVALLNVYESPEGWRSRCYRITYQSFSKALSRQKAIMVHQHIVCEGLTKKLGVIIF